MEMAQKTDLRAQLLREGLESNKKKQDNNCQPITKPGRTSTTKRINYRNRNARTSGFGLE